MGLDRRPFPEAETPREFFSRVGSVLSQVLLDADDPVVLVTHGGTVRAIIACWLGMTAEQYDLASFSTQAGSVTVLRCDSRHRRVLTRLGDMDHLVTKPVEHVD
jgi:broad specificity phosphatase PhoE